MNEQEHERGPADAASAHDDWDDYWRRRREVMLNRYYHDKPIETVLRLYGSDLCERRPTHRPLKHRRGTSDANGHTLSALLGRLASGWDPADRIRPMRGKRVLEVGAGCGADIVQFAHLGAEAYAIDRSSVALELVCELARREHVGVHAYQGDASCLPFEDGFFDVVYHLGLIEHFCEPVPILREQIRTLRSGGYLLVDVPQTYTLDAIRKRRAIRRGVYRGPWETSYTISELTALLESLGLSVVVTYARSYDFRPLLALRQAYKLSLGFVGKGTIYPLMPGRVGHAYNEAWNWFESRRFAYYLCWCIAAVGRVPGGTE
jgi:SAM-dependent methyltransferase